MEKQINRHSLIQEYYVLAIDKNGNLPMMYKDKAKTGFVVAGIIDLWLNNIIMIEKKKITVIKNLPDTLKHISSLYAYLDDKPHTINKIMSDYMFSTNKRIKQLITDIGESLYMEHISIKKKGGIFSNQILYIPEKTYQMKLIENIKLEMKESDISFDVTAFMTILKQTKILNHYFSQYEQKKMREKLKDINKTAENKLMVDMIHCFDDIGAIALFYMIINVC